MGTVDGPIIAAEMVFSFAMPPGRQRLAAVFSAILCMAATACGGGGAPAGAAGASSASAPPRVIRLKPGDPAPDFSLPGSDGKTYTLSSFRGRQPVVLAWFAKAFSAP